MKYRTKDGRANYGFSFEQMNDGTWRAFIVSQPGYGGRASDGETTHRNSDGDRIWVCWTEPIWTQAEIKQVAALWADKTQNYILYGERF